MSSGANNVLNLPSINALSSKVIHPAHSQTHFSFFLILTNPFTSCSITTIAANEPENIKITVFASHQTRKKRKMLLFQLNQKSIEATEEQKITKTQKNFDILTQMICYFISQFQVQKIAFFFSFNFFFVFTFWSYFSFYVH